MKMRMKSVGVFLMIFVLLEVICCQGCWKQERDSLLALNSHIGNTLSWLDDTDCCQWEGVECNATTGRVAKLDLLGKRGSWILPLHLNYSDFIVFKDLKSLNLSNNQIVDCTKIEGLENLEVLELSDNNFDNATSILSCLDGLSSLKSLTLSGNMLDATSFPVFETLSSKLLHLEVLDISDNYLMPNDILPSLRGFTSLKELYLSFIGLDSDLHIQGLCAVLINLEVLDMSDNNFNDSDIASALSGLSSLKSLYLRNCQITPRSIHNISKLRSLEILDLYSNYLNESIAWPLENDGFAWPTSLQVLGLSTNTFSNNILSSLSGLRRLKSLDLSGNQLKGSLNISGLLDLTNLNILDLSDNQINNFVAHQGSKSISKLDDLALDSNEINLSKLRESLRVFSSIRVLSLRLNKFKGTIVAGDFRDLSNLEHLALDGNYNLGNEFFRSIGELTSLKFLDVSACGINGTLPIGDWYKLEKLEELDLSFNEFVGPLPSSFVNMTSLRRLGLVANNFTGNIGPSLASLTSLEYLNFEANKFEFPISFTPFANHSNLKFIYGNGNKVILDSHSTLETWVPKFQLQELELSSTIESNSFPLPNFLLYQYDLTYLDFTGCKLGGEFPNWLLENNTKMTQLVLENNSFTGGFQLPSRPHLTMTNIDVSGNAITGQILTNISSNFPNLKFLSMSRNAIHGSIPHELSHMSSLVTLDLSDNQLSGEIPYNISRVEHQLKFLKLSNNKLDGSMPPILSMLSNLKYLFLDDNRLSGSIPSTFFNSSSIISLDISNNHFMGKIPSHIKNVSGLGELRMSNSHFEGSIPSELGELEYLGYLDLSQNNLTGCVPSFVNSLVSVIHLSNNSLSGLSKRMFNRSSSLVMLDLSYNEITNGIQDLLQDLGYTRLKILLMKGNHFTGNIPKQLCQLIDLNILDLSHNNFSGAIPNCLGKMPFENKDPTKTWDLFNGLVPRPHGSDDITFQFPYVREKANFNSKKRSETYTGNVLVYMSGIDLSYNELNGNIPFELGNLTRIRALNLSHNYLTGKIPATFSNLVQIESLDLSFNMLSGQIPPQLCGLTSLEVFTVAHNNLSGATPERKGQFLTFDENSYEGNQFLCGPPLPKSCNPNGQPPTTLPNGLNTDGDNDNWVDMYVFRVSFAVSYTSVVLVIVAILYINPYWRQAWFFYIKLVSMNCYYFIKDNLRKFFNIGNM